MVERYGVFTQRIARISRCIRRLKAEEMARFGLKGPHVSGLTEEQRSKMYAALELICGNLERLCAAEQEDTL